MLGDSSNRAERLEEAEDACFTAMECAKIGNAYATLLNDQETVISLIKDAVKKPSGSDFITLAGYAANAENNDLASSLITKTIAKFNRFAQFRELAEQLTAAGNAAASNIAFLAA